MKMIRAPLILGRIVTPDVVVAFGRSWVEARFLEPCMLIRGVVQDEIGDDFKSAGVGSVDKEDEVADRAEIGMDSREVRDVVAVVQKSARDTWGAPKCNRRQDRGCNRASVRVR